MTKNMKFFSKQKSFSLLFPLLLSLSACGNETQNGKTTLWTAYNTENLMSDLDYANDVDNKIDLAARGQTLKFSGMRGESEAAQLMISVDHDVNEFDFSCGDLSDNASHQIAASNLSVYAEKYMLTTISCEPDAYPGLYPDALIPLANYKFRKQNHIYIGTEEDTTRNPRNQGIWVNLAIPSDAVAGVYSGKGTLTLDGTTYEIPLKATIYDLDYPESVHQASCFLVWYDQIGYGEGQNSDDAMALAYYNFCVSHHMSPDQLPPNLRGDVASFVDYYAKNIADNPKISAYRLPLPTGKTAYEATLKEILQALIDKNIALRGQNKSTNLFAKIYSYVDDEPSASGYDLVLAHAASLKSVVAALAPQLDDYADLKASLLGLRNIVTTPLNETLYDTGNGGVNTWCPQYQHFQAPVELAKYQARQALGEHVWWYGCIDPSSPYPSYHTDAKLMTSRLISWMQYDYGIEGNLYWCVDYYRHYGKGGETSRDIWNDPNSWGNANGDGQLFYPGLEYGIRGPISTLRLESIREADEDYEYLYLFGEAIAQYNQAHSANVSARAILGKRYFTNLFNGVIANADSATYQAAHDGLLQDLVSLKTNLDATVQSWL
jgi:hypothetical protein